MILGVENVNHGYDGLTVFEDVSLSVDTGEVVAVIGPSGAGKSTLLRLLALFEQPNGGTISYEGEDVWSVSDSERLTMRRNVGMVFQEASLFNASALRNAEYGLRVRQSWADRIRRAAGDIVGRQNGTAQAATEALEIVGLEDQAEQDAGSLSGGEAQRVAFARALAYNPGVLLLDEPSSDLDPRNTAVLEKAIDEARDRGIGIVIATHDMNQAQRIADRTAVLLNSEVIEIDTTDRIFEDPHDERTEKFITGELVY